VGTSDLSIKLHDKQAELFESTKRIIIGAAGISSGKTFSGSAWMMYQMFKHTHPDDTFLITAPTVKILNQATLPAFLKIMKPYGNYRDSKGEFETHWGTKAYIRSLHEPDLIEGIQNIKAAWGDEAGQYSKYAWENLSGRTARTQAQVILTTTPYALNWLFLLYKEWKKGNRDDVDFVIWKSKDSPYFPDEEFNRQKKLLDPVRFAMKYEGMFGQMEGLVYKDIVTINAKVLPPNTVYYIGLDWGFTDPFAMVIRAITPEGVHYRVSEFMKSGLTISEIVDICKARAQLYNPKAFICDPSRPDCIEELNKNGLNAMGGDNRIAIGIDKHRELMKSKRFFVFSEENPYGLDEYSTYHYPEPKELKIDDSSKEQLPVDANNHSMDCDRYLTMYTTLSEGDRRTAKASTPGTMPRDQIQRIKWLKAGGSNRFNNC
jgi:PBSX family phage terminase large subunit